MLLPIVALSGIFQLVVIVNGDEASVVRHAEGDIFTVEGSCDEACTASGSTYSRVGVPTASAGVAASNGTCVCQCNEGLPVFREDLNICVSDIHECSVARFVSNTGQIEKVPYVYLPQRGQIIYPQAEIRFEGVTTPVCGIAGAQQLGKSGWLEFRNLSNAEPPFRLFRDAGVTFLQWIGESGLRDAAEGKIVIARLVCRDAASPHSSHPGVFTPCVAFRVAGSPSKSNVREVTFAATGQSTQGLSTVEYIAIGISSVLLALIYVASVSLYLHSRSGRRKNAEEPEVPIIPSGRDGAGLVKNNPLLVAARHFESDTNSGHSDDDLGDDLAQSDAEQNFENQVTSAIIHPAHCMYMEYTEGPFGTGTIVGERLPEEDVRIVETIENAHQQDTPVLPGTQRRKLYFNPAYFERQLLLAPPPAAIEFLLKIREVISIAKHKMSAKRFVPTLTGIPEEESASERCGSTANNKQRGGSVQGSVARSRKSQRCTGCPGCTEPASRNLPILPDSGRPATMGDDISRVRAWLEDVKPPERRWKDAEDGRRNFQENARTFARSLEHIKEMAKADFLRSECANLANRSLASWKDNPPMLRTFQNIARSEILEDADRHSASRRSTRSMFEESSHDRYHGADRTGPEDTINAKVRKAIENSFIKQMEENAALESQSSDRPTVGNRHREDESQNSSSPSGEPRESTDESKIGNAPPKKSRKSRAPTAPSNGLPDMIDGLPAAKIPAKRIMDAVIKEMVDVKALEHHPRIGNVTDYEVDSLERTNRKSPATNPSASPKIARQPTTSFSALKKNAEEKIGADRDKSVADETNPSNVEPEEFRLNDDVRRRNYYNNLPELVTQRPEGYSLVSEVYVNDGYVSPTGSDDSGPEISYEPENPGHLTIKVQDSPQNYVRHDDSEYEPDTLDRKPMRLKINGDVIYDREPSGESYVDSLERPAQISLRSRGSFRLDGVGPLKNGNGSLQRGYGSLREIYEARLRSNLKDSSLVGGSARSLNGDLDDGSTSWKRNKYLTPDMRQAKRQRKPQNQPDVVPLPPAEEAIYQQPKPPRRVERAARLDADDNATSVQSKNARDRSHAEAVNPTAGEGSPVPVCARQKCVGCPTSDESRVVVVDDDDDDDARGEKPTTSTSSNGRRDVPRRKSPRTSGAIFSSKSVASESNPRWETSSTPDPPWKAEFEKRSSRRRVTTGNSGETQNSPKETTAEDPRGHRGNSNGEPTQRARKSSATSRATQRVGNSSGVTKVEDSGYLSSTDSNGSQRQLLRHEFGSVSETDETESICDGASESGAESVGTDSVFFGNFRRLSEMSNFSKSVDSGVDVGVRNPLFEPFGARNESAALERSGAQTSDSESESFVTVFRPDAESRRNSLVR